MYKHMHVYFTLLLLLLLLSAAQRPRERGTLSRRVPLQKTGAWAAGESITVDYSVVQYADR